MDNLQYVKQAHRFNVFHISFCYVFFTLALLFLIPQKLNAQLVGTYMDYEGSISADEEGNTFLLPTFVYAEPVMDEIYIIDGTSRIMIYTTDFLPLFTLGEWEGIEKPNGLVVDAQGNLYVAQSRSKNNPRSRISVYNACFKWDRDIYFEGFEGAETFEPHRLAIDKEGNLYIAANYFPGILVLDRNNRLIEVISPEEEGNKAKLMNVTIDKSGKIYLVNEELGHIYVYDENRQFLFKFGEKGGSTGKLSHPRAIGIDNRDGKMYVVDYMRHAINAYDKEGNFVFEFGGQGWSAGWFQFPTTLTIDSKGKIWVADFFNNRIQVFAPRLLSKKPIGIDIVQAKNQTFTDDSYTYDSLLGYNLQYRLKIEQRNQKIRFPLP